jgi:hypothetical protein
MSAGRRVDVGALPRALLDKAIAAAALVAGALVGSVLLAGAEPAFAAARAQTAGAGVTVSPTQAEPGETVRVSVSGVSELPATGTTLCVGFLGPGSNLELGISPRFQSRLGTVAVSASGSGAADVRVPVQAAAGVYRIRVGGCPPQPDLAPLAAIAETQLTVTRSGPNGLPASGEAGPYGVAAAGMLAALVAAAGLRRRAA